MKILKKISTKFYDELYFFLKKRSVNSNNKIDIKVKKIISNVIKNGDKAIIHYAKEFDDSKISKNNILISKEIRNSYKKKISKETMNAFKLAIKNITNYHKKQIPRNYKISNKGMKTRSIWNSIDSVGLYIPGGVASYPSSLIMNVVPAKVAGVKRIVVATPSKSNIINPYILALLDELNIDEVYQVGGAHAIAALAYGTKSIKPVNKIFGPGNAYVLSAKKEVYGKVGIDILAGPSEIVVVANKHNNPKWVASDLIAQAEHDEKAQSILITDNEDFANKVIECKNQLTMNLSRNKTINKSLDNHGLIIINKMFSGLHEIINFIAPEHLHLHIKISKNMLSKIKNVGCIFLGEYSSEAFGDYIAGTNHILPTSGSAKFSSGVGVLDFMKRTSVVEINSKGFRLNQDNVVKMTDVEKLDGHKLSVKIRQTRKK